MNTRKIQRIVYLCGSNLIQSFVICNTYSNIAYFNTIFTNTPSITKVDWYRIDLKFPSKLINHAFLILDLANCTHFLCSLATDPTAVAVKTIKYSNQKRSNILCGYSKRCCTMFRIAKCGARKEAWTVQHAW